MTIDKNSTDQELMDAFEAGNNAGDGFGAGETTDSPFEAADREDYVILRSIEANCVFNGRQQAVFCEDGDDLIVIANVSGPWAVTVGKVVA